MFSEEEMEETTLMIYMSLILRLFIGDLLQTLRDKGLHQEQIIAPQSLDTIFTYLAVGMDRKG